MTRRKTGLAAAALTSLALFALWLNTSIRVFLLKITHNRVPNLLHVLIRKRPRRRNTEKSVNNPLNYPDAEFGVDDGVSEVNAPNGNAHDDLFGGRVCLGRDVPRFRVFFVKDGCRQRCSNPDDE